MQFEHDVALPCHVCLDTLCLSTFFVNQTISTSEESSPLPGGAGSFTEGTVHSHLIKFTGYMVLGFISIMTASLMETVYIGQVGTKELAAISFTFPLVMIMQAISMGLTRISHTSALEVDYIM